MQERRSYLFNKTCLFSTPLTLSVQKHWWFSQRLAAKILISILFQHIHQWAPPLGQGTWRVLNLVWANPVESEDSVYCNNPALRCSFLKRFFWAETFSAFFLLKKWFVSFLFEKTVKILLIQFQTVGGWIRHETSPTDKEAIVKNLGENYHKWHILRKLTALTDTF